MTLQGSKPVNSFILPSGRTIGWLEFGDPQGFPALYCHGTPGSGLEAEIFDEPGKTLGVRIISPDRPGIAHSDPAEGRTVADWGNDADELLQHLGCEEYSTFGWSGGAPHALLAALQSPEKVRSIGLLAPLGDTPRWATKLERAAVRPLHTVLSAVTKLPNIGASLLSTALGVGDPDPRRSRTRDLSFLGRSLQRSQRQGSEGTINDLITIVERWGTSLPEIGAQLAALDAPLPITIWQGGKDTTIHLRQTQALARQLPHTTLWVDQPATHLQILLDHPAEVLQTLLRPRTF